MKFGVIVAFLLLQAGCGPVSFSGGRPDFEAPLPHGCKLYCASAHHIIVLTNDLEIPPKVVELGHDDDFIIAKQNHLRRRSPQNPNDTYEEPAPGVFSFWIIDLRKPESFGPLAEEEFVAKRNELGVPEAVGLHSVYDFKPKPQQFQTPTNATGT